MASAQIEGDGTASVVPDELIKWLAKNNLQNKKLIDLLIEEEIDNVGDLIAFKNSLGDDEFTKIFFKKGIKIGKIGKLIKALNKYGTESSQNHDNKNDNDQNKSSSSIIMLDKQEKEAIKLLSSKSFEIESKLTRARTSLPKHSKKLSASKELIKQEISNICNEWIKLIHEHKKSLYQWVESVEETELNKNKSINKKLNDELHLIQETKLKCQGLMSYASINDIWTPKQSQSNEQSSKDNILSLVTDCVSKLDKTLDISENNIFDKLKFAKFDKNKAKELLGQHINILTEKEPKLSVNVVKREKVEFTVEDELNLYTSRELFVKVSDMPLNDNDDEKKNDMNGMTKLCVVNNTCSITVQDLDNKLGENTDYVAYIVDNFGKIAFKRNEIAFKILRLQEFTVERACVDKADNWGYTENNRDVVCFKTNENITLLGIGVLPGQGQFTAKVTIYKDDNANDMVAESELQTFQGSNQKEQRKIPLKLLLKDSATITKNTRYTVVLKQT
eukprot:441838_1